MRLDRGLSSFGGGGFHMKFDNGWSVSVHWVEGNYSANDLRRNPHGLNQSPNAEVLIESPEGKCNTYGWQNPEQVAFLLSRTARRMSPRQKERAKADEERVMMFMNEFEIDIAVQQSLGIRRRAARYLSELRDETNAHSDGWAHWPAPCKAARKLMGLIQAPNAPTERELAKALAPIRAFMTRRGNAAGMRLKF